MLRTAATIAVALLIAACDRLPPLSSPEPVSVEAYYRLTFNDKLVGRALFTLDIDAQRYRLRAFTTPAGDMRDRGQHEVLESSSGIVTPDALRPLRYQHSVLADGELTAAGMHFDWTRRQVKIDGATGNQSVGLLPDTHDRLSYLLDAQRLAASGEGVRLIQIASLTESAQTRLSVAGKSVLTLPLGHFDATLIERVTPDADEQRRLWFDPDYSMLPLRIVHIRDDQRSEMRLEEINRVTH